MSLTSRVTVSLCAASLMFAASAQEKSKKKQLTARELFYAAVQAPSAAISPASKLETPKATPKARVPRPMTSKPVEVARAEEKPVPSMQADHSALPDGAQVIHASAGSQPALGLRYTILKVAGASTIEVAPDAVFHAGDRIQLKVEANNPGYLYVVSQGSSGTWKPIFPSPEVESGNNKVESLHAYTLPSEEHHMVFNETAGNEKLFIILSRQPESDLEKMIYSLQAKPAGQKTDEPVQSSKQLIMADNLIIDGDTVGRMRKAYARDLVIEKVTPATPGEKRETAVYVVNPSGSASSRVVADLSLVHQ